MHKLTTFLASVIAFFISRFRTDRMLGIAHTRGGRYDIPLDTGPGTVFLKILTGLLTFLAVLALCGALIASTVSNHWTASLAGAATIEIPAHTADGAILPPAAQDDLADKTYDAIKNIGGITAVERVDRADVGALVAPFLGTSSADVDDFRLPVLLSVQYTNQGVEGVGGQGDKVLDYIANTIADIAPTITIDTHETWLDNIARLSRVINLGALILAIIIITTLVIALVSAMNSRMQIHRSDIELLHLMGASHAYIARQFQRHARVIALRGSVMGAILGAGVLFITLMVVSGGGAVFNLSSLSLGARDILILCALPFVICVIAMFSARYTVLRALAQMP